MNSSKRGLSFVSLRDDAFPRVARELGKPISGAGLALQGRGLDGPINCDKYWMCAMVCQCDAGGCHAKNEVTNTVDIGFDGAKADGSITFGVNYNLRLTRDP